MGGKNIYIYSVRVSVRVCVFVRVEGYLRASEWLFSRMGLYISEGTCKGVWIHGETWIQARVGIGKGDAQTYMVNDDNLPRAQQLLRDNQRPQRLARPPAGVADDVRVAFGEAQRLGGVEAGVHASHDGDFSIPRQRTHPNM